MLIYVNLNIQMSFPVNFLSVSKARTLTLCRTNLNPYCMGRKAAFFFQWAFKFTYVPVRFSAFRPADAI
jgi:hypothetical protein